LKDARRENISDRIKKALIIKGIKQSELCDLTKIPKSAISQYISGAFEPKKDRISIIAKSLNVSEMWLMGYDVPMEKEKSPSINDELSESIKMLIELFERIPVENQPMVLEMIRAALKAQGLL
jgi:transcriptional regulator with XRE-family HTH domain